MSSAIDLSVIIPIYNEEANLPALYQRLTMVSQDLGVSYELIFVNDGSRDKSADLMKALAMADTAVRYVILSRNFGHQIAVSAGLDRALGGRVAIIDADLQDPPELIADLWNKMDDGFEVVYARRRKRPGESWLKLLTAKVFYRLLASITSVSIPVDTGDFRLMDAKVVHYLKLMPEQHKFLRGQISWIGFRQTYIEYDRQERAGGVTGYTYAKMIKFAMDGITSFSDFPLKLATFTGFTISGVAALVLIYALYGKLVSHTTVDGWASLMVSILFLGGVQLVTIGIIGEYIGRLSQNVKNRPLYIVDEEKKLES
jgi:dolichol-phosphate mannosyltransferase